jgi:hypothetical protein
MLINCEITDDRGNLDVEIATTSQGLFKFKTPAVLPASCRTQTLSNESSTAAATQIQCAPLRLSKLRKPLPLSHASLTRSELIFSAATSINPQSLVIAGGEEFYLFMDLCAMHQWASFRMNSQKWVTATRLFNEAFTTQQHEKRILDIIKKNPRALMDKLGEIEPKIVKQIATQNYTCKPPLFCVLNLSHILQALHSNSEDFWRKHYHAVSLAKNEASAPSLTANKAVGKVVSIIFFL